MKVYIVTCFLGGHDVDTLSIWSSRELAEQEVARIKADPQSGATIYGYDLSIDEWEVDVSEQPAEGESQ